jgi:hypothetical protein
VRASEADQRSLFGSWQLGVGGWTIATVIVCGVSVACGKKGPPLAPLVPIPSAVETIAAERVGNDVFVSFTIPIDNIDDYTPADLGRIDVYGYTGRTAPPRGRIFEFGTLVASVRVAPPPPEPGEEPKPGAAPVDPKLPLQGVSVTVRDTLTADELAQGKLPAAEPRAAPEPGTKPEPPNKNAEPGTRNRELEAPLKRFYTTLPYSARGRPGPQGTMAELALTAVPPAPPSAEAAYSEQAIQVSWEPAGGLIGFLLENALPDEVPFFVEDDPAAPPVDRPSGPVLYNVYREIAPDPLAPPSPADEARQWNEAPPAPVNPLPVKTLSFTDSVEFGRTRCYTVRGVRGIAADARVGDPSPPVCVTPIDTFPPAPPQSLAAVTLQGAVDLIWEPSGDLDLGGYLVLRAEAPGDTLQPLTRMPVTAARYRDDTVSPGVRYVYAVVAVDNRFPVPNISLESNRIEETAR